MLNPFPWYTPQGYPFHDILLVPNYVALFFIFWIIGVLSQLLVYVIVPTLSNLVPSKPTCPKTSNKVVPTKTSNKVLSNLVPSKPNIIYLTGNPPKKKNAIG